LQLHEKSELKEFPTDYHPLSKYISMDAEGFNEEVLDMKI